MGKLVFGESMEKLLVGNAPCSWGTLEHQDASIPFGRMLDELVETGYTGTELGDWGYMPIDSAELRSELAQRNGLTMLGAFVPVALKDQNAHAAGIALALKTARLLASVASDPKPYLVLADDNGTDPVRTKHAGRVTPGLGLSKDEWKIFAKGAEGIAQAVFDQTGLRTVFHHHCAGYVETPDEISTLLDLTNSELLGLVFDTGHFYFGSSRNDCDLTAALNRFAHRIWYVHLKDLQPQIADQSRREEWDYFASLRHGVFCELGKGCVDFPSLLKSLAKQEYQGYVLVEQDVLPGMGTPKESALRNREYIRSIETNFA